MTATPGVSMLRPVELTDSQFERISGLVRSLCGINLHQGKRELIKARLGKRLRQLGITCFGEYLKLVADDPSGAELTAMLDALSTNLTSFFREADHFDHLRQVVIPRIMARSGGSPPRVRVWSAGCSSGEEAYSIAITALEAMPGVAHDDVRILGTDISTNMLARALGGKYAAARLKGLAPGIRAKYFSATGTRKDQAYTVQAPLRQVTRFARLNLISPWPMRGPFDAIFCRNVMIYFDRPTREQLIDRFADLLADGGVLYVGHSESLTGIRHPFKYVQPTVYERPPGRRGDHS